MTAPVPLKPCPFCGGEAHAPKAIGGHSSAFRIVQCSRSDSCGSVAGSTDAEAIAAWNTRTDPERDALKARVEALVEAVLAVVNATRAYLPPDGVDAQECINRILEATDNPKINPIILETENGLN